MANFLKWINNLLRAFMGVEYQEVEKTGKEGLEKELVVVMEPNDFNGSKDIVNELKQNKVVIFNLDNLGKDESRRVLDFISGAVFVLGYKLRNSGKMVYTSEPRNSIFTSSDDE
ncbi:MAG: Cell division protein SepF [candidate division WS2 bacterium]|uniref:Cell division protein SepF n=1 Tax=Psychracetigena formicireducens TaxID=2986056 RepID=A0A9E2F6R0_PSYF1|nr:Cell division protein SepF [Candidatus Psychracetigena formicireducens]MBT9144838.1 Cell division protein SepF [Candidatus Psychracetigena formicireducens]